MATEGKTSRLALMQMRFQQKQQIEINQKRSEMASRNLTNLTNLDVNDNSTKFTATLGAGKVRQMFDERRQRITTGIDKSYPLQPISSRKSPVPPGSNMMKSNSTLSDGRPNGDVKLKLNRLPVSADANMNLDKVNGNHATSNKLYHINDSLDNKKIREFFDDSMVGKNTSTFKLPSNHSGRPTSSFSKGNGNVKLKPVMSNNVIPIVDSNSRKPINAKKLTPVANKPVTTIQSLKTTSKPTIGVSSKSNIQTPSNNSVGSAKNKLARPATPPENMAACENCGRFFDEERVSKHETICKKQKKRKIFDTTKHRVQGTEAEAYVKKALKTTPKKQAAAPEKKKNNWRQKHEEFIAAIRSAKQVQAHLAAGGKLSDLPPPPPSENPDYVQCPHCLRRFNQTAADRHIPKCANFQHNKPKVVPKKRY